MTSYMTSLCTGPMDCLAGAPGNTLEITGLFLLIAVLPRSRPFPSRNYCLFFGTYEEEANGVRKDWKFSRNGLAATAGGGCNGGSIRRNPAGPPYARSRCLGLHIGPVGLCSGLADRRLSVFVSEGLPLPPIFWRAIGAGFRATLASDAFNIPHPTGVFHP
jgi:hypothetical protein